MFGGKIGESIVWDHDRGALHREDIGGKRVRRLRLSNARHQIWPTRDFPASVGPCRTGVAILCLTRKRTLWDTGEGLTPFAVAEPDLPANRMNAGRTAALWSDRHLVHGLEPVCVAFDPCVAASAAPHRISRSGIPTARQFRVGPTLTTHDRIAAPIGVAK